MLPQVLEELFPLWFAHLSDVIPSVRQDAAAALADAVRAYGDEALQRILPQLRWAGLALARVQEQAGRRGEGALLSPAALQRKGCLAL